MKNFLTQINVQELKMYVDLKDKVISTILYNQSFYEKYTTNLFKKLVKKNMNIVDIGANIGYYTLIGASLVNNKGKVFAFEPESLNYSLLLKNIKLNNFSNITPINKAVSNISGITKLFLSKDNYGAHRIYRRHDGRKSIPVKTITLDDYFNNNKCKIDLVKIDAEGAEMAILQGMKNIIKNNKNLIILTEFVPMRLKRFGFSPKEFINRLIKYGFKIRIINEEKKLSKYTNTSDLMKLCKQKICLNLLCIKKYSLKNNL